MIDTPLLGDEAYDWVKKHTPNPFLHIQITKLAVGAVSELTQHFLALREGNLRRSINVLPVPDDYWQEAEHPAKGVILLIIAFPTGKKEKYKSRQFFLVMNDQDEIVAYQPMTEGVEP